MSELVTQSIRDIIFGVAQDFQSNETISQLDGPIDDDNLPKIDSKKEIHDQEPTKPNDDEANNTIETDPHTDRHQMTN